MVVEAEVAVAVLVTTFHPTGGGGGVHTRPGWRGERLGWGLQAVRENDWRAIHNVFEVGVKHLNCFCDQSRKALLNLWIIDYWILSGTGFQEC